jgi:DNA modification methylase
MGQDYSTGNKNVKLYDDNDGKGKYTLVYPKDWWEIGMLATSSKERIGYPTQKPEELIARIVKACTDPGDLVADFFSGSGTTVTVAEKLNRKWIGCDISKAATSVARDRIKTAYNKKAGIQPINPKPNSGFQIQIITKE